MKIEVILHFGGFYGSIHEYIVNSAIDYELECDDSIDIDAIDYIKTYENYAKALVSAFSKEICVKIEYKELNSPKYYNFVTDTITVIIDSSDTEKIIELAHKEKVEALLEEWATPSDGYIPFYSVDELKKNNVFVLEAALKIIFDDLQDNFFDIEFEIERIKNVTNA